jgi:RNA-directed DNA polymerase
MKRLGNLWPQIVEFDNLYIASRQAQKGKRFRENVLTFNYALESEIFTLQSELIKQSYQPGAYRTFEIRDPKPRLISAAPYRDRVIHHALCNIIVPPLDKTMIGETYANRSGYGTHRALKQFTFFARSHQYILQGDIRKYFPSIDHEILKSLLRRKIKCPETLWLIDTIIDGSNEQESSIHYYPGDKLLALLQRRRGLPISNLTSQFFANFYLSPFDHFVKEQLKIRSYLRYVDDFALFSDDREQLAHCLLEMEIYLQSMRLSLHPIKTQLLETKYGANFVGFRFLPDRIRIRGDNLRRARQRLRYLQKEYRAGRITLLPLVKKLQSWESHLKHGDTYRLRRKVFDHHSFVRQEQAESPITKNDIKLNKEITRSKIEKMRKEGKRDRG